MRNPTPQAFTLVEAVLIVSILSVIGLALFHSFSDGIKIWERSRQFFAEEDVAIFFDKIEHDLKNCFFYSQIPFEGKEERLRFATRVKAFQPGEGMGSVEYYFDPFKQNIYRREANYGQALKNYFSKERLLASHLQSVRFFYYSAESHESNFQDQLNDVIPRAILIEVEFLDRRGLRVLKKMINIPLGEQSSAASY